MQIVDSHCHIDRVDLNAFGGSIESMLEHASELSVTKFLCVCIDLEHFDQVHNLSKSYSNIFASVGVHPTEMNCKEPSVKELLEYAQSDRVIAIGETGLDYFHVRNASNDSGKPMIIHMRDSKDDTIEILSSERAKKGVMHCFAEDMETAKAALDLGFYISFSGIITFKSAQDLREVAKQIPSDRILIETDSPYLTPVPYRGKPNSPAYTYYVAEKLAEIRNSSVSEIARVTTQNFNQLFFS